MGKHYSAETAAEIVFPLGGIGSGCMGLAGNGGLVDFEIFGCPNKKSRNGFSHFSIKAENGQGIVDARILQGDLQPGYMGDYVRGGALHSGYGFGPEADTLAGLPHFAKCEFEGRFPMATLHFEEEAFPGGVTLTAFGPFIPHNDRDSSIPAAFFEWEIANTTAAPLRYTLALSMRNPAGPARNAHLPEEQPGFCGLHLTQAPGEDVPKRRQGGFCIATDAPETSYQQYWYRGGWCDDREMYLRDLNTPGRFINRAYPTGEGEPRFDTATLAAHLDIPAGGTGTVRFVTTWYYPHMCNDWNPERGDQGKPIYRFWKHYYASLFADAVDVAKYALTEFSALRDATALFTGALHGSTLPEAVLDAVTANLSVLKSPVCYRLEQGEFYAFEGAIADVGSCEGSCTHVWNYAYALPFLFPSLERSMRDLEYRYCMGEAGDVTFRLTLPLGRERSGFRPCVDGQMGGILKCYRDWKISGDTGWLRDKWPSLQKALAYAWSPQNPDRWDPDQEGLLSGRQHHTLDMELFGANAWLSGFYLAALKAAAEMAVALGDPQAAYAYTALYEKGKKRLNTELFGGSYYGQNLDLKDPSILAAFGDASAVYWNGEAGEIKYQSADGCEIDQMVAQWHANLCGLGDIFDGTKTKIALQSLYQHNFVRMRDVANTWRLFALQGESGLLMCTWPGERPAVPLTYATECMTGFEYAAACHMIQEGMLQEGLSVVRAVRDRYDGRKRNPWNEIECGSNYARSMASYSLLLAYSGFRYDLARGMIGFHPIGIEGATEALRYFWSVGEAYGTASFSPGQAEIIVLGGSLALRSIELPFVSGPVRASLGGMKVEAGGTGESLSMDVRLCPGQPLVLRYGASDA